MRPVPPPSLVPPRLRAAGRIALRPPPIRPALTSAFSSPSSKGDSEHPSLDALFQSPKLKTNPAAFARQVRKRVGEYRDRQQSAAAGPGRHPLAPSPRGDALAPSSLQPLQTLEAEHTSIRLYDTHLVLSPLTPSSPELRIGYTFLRDACPCPHCVQRSTKQKLFKAGEAYEELHGGSASTTTGADAVPSLGIRPPAICVDTQKAEQGLTIHWPSHTSFYPFPLLRNLADPSRQPVEQSLTFLTPVEWPTRAALLRSPTLRIGYTDLLASRATQHGFLAQLVKYGLVVLTGVPTKETDDAHCSARHVMEQIGELRNTFYGTTWDVKAVPESRNIAYTDVDLGFHQDLWYARLVPSRIRLTD